MALKTDCSTPEWLIKREMIMKRRAANRPLDEDISSSSASDKALTCSQPFSTDYANVPAVHPCGRSVAPRHSSRQHSESRTLSSCKTATHSPARGSVPGTVAADDITSLFRYASRPKIVNGVRQRWFSAEHRRPGMGEDACPDKNSGRDDCALEPLLISDGKGTHFAFENDQEFQYGPGIVDKLKTKFINLSLKERKDSGDGKIRRFSSLENLLENDFQASDFVKRKRPITTIGAKGGGNTLPLRMGFKRAKSMETLLFESEQRTVSASNLRRRPLSSSGDVSESVLINENLVIIESDKPSDITPGSKVIRRKDTLLNRQTSVTFISDEELPKPDIVKTCKLIFEPATRRAVNSSSVRKAPVVRHSAKNWANNNRYISGAQQQHGAITEKTETVLLASPKSCAKANSEQSGVLCNGDAQLMESRKTNGVSEHKPSMCEINNDKNKAHGPNTARSKCISDDSLSRIRSHGTSLNFGGSRGPHSPKKIPMLATGRPRVTTPKIPSPVRSTPNKKFPVEIVPSRVQQNVPSKPDLEVSSPTKEAAPLKVDHVSLPDPVAITNLVEELFPAALAMPEEPIECTPPPVPLVNGDATTTVHPEEVPTSEEKLNSVFIEAEILKPSTLMGNKKPLWQKPPPTTTTMVFDFRGKDVKSHLPVNPAPFGCKPTPRGTNRRKKRSSSPPLGGDGSSIVTNGAINGVLLMGDGVVGESKDYDDDYNDDDDFDDLDLGGSLPHPSGIVFSGGNVIVGRGSLLAVRNKKLKIQFNDGATSIHEYQSESSAVDDYDVEHTGSSKESSPNSIETSLSTSLVNSPALSAASSGGLANYTPSMLSSTESFQLGVQRPIHEIQPTPPVEEPQKSPEEEEIKPADPDETSSWSSSTTSDLLF